MSHPNGVRAAVLAAAATEHGVSTSSLPGYSIKQIGRSVQKLCEVGRLFAARLGRRNVHYFDTMQRAEAYEALHKGKCIEGVSIKPRKEAETPTINPRGIKPNKVAAPKPRFAPDENDESWQAFSKLKPGQYLTEPSSCAARAFS